jgi:hypothetical protein
MCSNYNYILFLDKKIPHYVRANALNIMGLRRGRGVMLHAESDFRFGGFV